MSIKTTTEDTDLAQCIRSAAILEHHINKLRQSRERQLALTKLEECVHWLRDVPEKGT